MTKDCFIKSFCSTTCHLSPPFPISPSHNCHISNIHFSLILSTFSSIYHSIMDLVQIEAYLHSLLHQILDAPVPDRGIRLYLSSCLTRKSPCSYSKRHFRNLPSLPFSMTNTCPNMNPHAGYEKHTRYGMTRSFRSPTLVADKFNPLPLRVDPSANYIGKLQGFWLHFDMPATTRSRSESS